MSAPDLTIAWRKAAALGGLWASIEIILGGFLHAVQFPLAGTALAAIGSAILIAGSRTWPDRGLVWRAGVICALMKSVSPSAVIFGPMAGILAEAGLLEATVRLLGRRTPAYLLGAALAVATPFLQKIVGLLVTYGADVARLYAAVYDAAASGLGVSSVGPFELLALILASNIVLGIAAGLLGLSLARRAAGEAGAPPVDLATATVNLFDPDPAQRYSIARLIGHLLALPIGMLALGVVPLAVSAAACTAYVGASALHYTRIAARLARPRLWAEFAVVALLAGLFLGGAGRPAASWEGVAVGLRMVLRAALVVVSFSAVSVEVRNPAVLAWFLRRGMHRLTAALAVSFGALPAMTALLGNGRRFARHPVRHLARVFAMLVHWVEHTDPPPGRPVFLLTGDKGAGKTTFLNNLAGLLRGRGLTIGGVTSPSVAEDGRRVGYDLLELHSGTRIPLCRERVPPTGIAAGPFQFFPHALNAGSKAIDDAVRRRCAVIMIDEVGPLELEGGGWCAASRAALRTGAAPMIIAVRPSLVEPLKERWGLGHCTLWSVGTITLDGAAAALTAPPP